MIPHHSKIAVSNLAWPASRADAALSHARSLGFSGIEIAPSKTFDGWPDDILIKAAIYRAQLADLGFAIPAMQAITFGIDGISLFGSGSERISLVAHLRMVARLAGALGAGACVFGAPKLRDPGSQSYEAAFSSAVALFGTVAPYFSSEGSTLAFEANPTAYGCNFITTTSQAIDLVEAVGHPGFRLQIDIGTIILNRERPAIIAKASPLASHLHVSEPMLQPLGKSDHSQIAREIQVSGYAHWRSVEMQETKDWREAMTSAAKLLTEQYL
jgi:sugar phosphate isomerase/epimerase